MSAEPRLRRVAPPPVTTEGAGGSSYDDFAVATTADDSPRTTDRTNPPTRGNSFASFTSPMHGGSTSAPGAADAGDDAAATNAAPSPPGPDCFTRDDEFRLKSLQRILASHSGNPLDPADAAQLCAELAELEEKQQRFLRASLARMHADAASAGNLRAGRGGAGAGWGGWLKRAVTAVVGPSPPAPVRKAAADSGDNAASSGGGVAVPMSQKLKVDASVSGSDSDATDATVIRHGTGSVPVASPADSVGPSPAHRTHAQDVLFDAGPLATRHQRVNSTGASTLVRRAVAAPPGAREPWVVVPSTPTPAVPTPPAEHLSDAEEAMGGAAEGHAASVVPISGADKKDDNGPANEGARARPSSTLQGRRTIRQAAAGIVSNWRREAFGAASALGVGPVRPVILVTAALLMVLVATAPADVFSAIGQPGVGASVTTARRPGDLLAVPPETAEGYLARHRRAHSVTHLAAAAVALYAGAVLLQPSAAARRDRTVLVVRIAHVAAGLALAALLGDIAVAAVELHRARGAVAHAEAKVPPSAFADAPADVWDAVDATVGTSILLFWYAAVDAVVFLLATNVLQRLAGGAAATTAAGTGKQRDTDGTPPTSTPKNAALSAV